MSASSNKADGHVVSMDLLSSGLRLEEVDNNLSHKWDYMHQQTLDEVVAFKIYDSDLTSVSDGTPHTTMQIPGTEDERLV